MELLHRLKRDTKTRNKLLAVFAMMFLLLIGYRIPLPGINAEQIRIMMSPLLNTSAGGFLNAMMGNSLSQMSIFALSITPYITASILIQLLGVIVPSIEAMQKDGSVGRQKIERLTYMLGAIVAVIESLGLAIGLGKQGMFYNYSWYMVLYATVVWTIGACFLIWCGQFITNKLIGNGISLILMFNILTSLPGNIINIYNQFSYGQPIWVKIITVVTIIIVFALMYGYTVVLGSAEKRLPVTNSSKSGMKMNGAQSNDLPLKLNMGGVMPIIFSSSMMSVPMIIGQVFKVDTNSVGGHIIACFNQGMWFNLDSPWYTVGVLLFIPLTFVFAYFYSMISFNPKDIADNLKKSGSVIKGIRPGDPTTEYLTKQARSMLWLGTSMLLVIALFPTIISGLFGISGLSFGGTTIIIIVGTILEMKNTITAQTSSVAYRSLIKKRGNRR